MHDFYRGDQDKEPKSPASKENSLEFLDLSRMDSPSEAASKEARETAREVVVDPAANRVAAPAESRGADAPLARAAEASFAKSPAIVVSPDKAIRKSAATAKSKRPSKKTKLNPWWIAYFIFLTGTIFYFGFIAKDRYVSTARFAIIRGGNTAASDESLSLFMGSSQSQQDAYTAIAHIQSIDMLRWIDDSTDLNFREHFSDAGLDIFNRLDADSPVETASSFLSDRVTARLDDAEGLVTVEAEGFTPEFAQQLSTIVLERIETFLNGLNREIADQSTTFLMEDLKVSEEKLNNSRQALLAFQNDNLTVDPQADVQSRLELIQSLKKQKVFNQAEQMRLRRESPASPHIAVLDSQIAAMDAEMARESESLTGDGPNQLNRLLASYSKLNQDLNFATERYLQNLQIVEEIRLQTLSQHRYISVVQNPFLPEDSLRPQRLYWTISFAIVGLLAMQVVRLSVRTVVDHG